ncbi:hypothetical protein SDJN02_12863 [Cucurbita argyrosperma subsp. argyrosperma]|nr:hypothetical protein SDJN02_12863 [Cucurbita argyrosperma subsp. argyrosperma]
MTVAEVPISSAAPLVVAVVVTVGLSTAHRATLLPVELLIFVQWELPGDSVQFPVLAVALGPISSRHLLLGRNGGIFSPAVEVLQIIRTEAVLPSCLLDLFQGQLQKKIFAHCLKNMET